MSFEDKVTFCFMLLCLGAFIVIGWKYDFMVKDIKKGEKIIIENTSYKCRVINRL